MAEQESINGIKKEAKDIGPYIEITFTPSPNFSNVTSESFLVLKKEHVNALQKYVGERAEVVIHEVHDTYAGEDTTDTTIIRIIGTITHIIRDEVGISAESGEIAYSDSGTKQKLEPGWYKYRYGTRRYSERFWGERKRITKILVDGENILPDEDKPRDRWENIDHESRLLLERIEELVDSIRPGKTLVFTYWRVDSDIWSLIQSSTIGGNQAEIIYLNPKSRDLAIRKAPYWYWAVGKIEEATRSDEYNWRYERFGLGVTIQIDGSLKAVDFVRGRERIASPDLQELSGQIDKDVFIGYICDSMPESLQKVISILEENVPENFVG